MRPPVRPLLLALLLTAVGATSGCRRANGAGEGGGAALMANLMRARALEVVVDESALRAPLSRAAARLSRGAPDTRFEAVVRESGGDPRVPRVVVGTCASPSAQALARRAGVEILAGGRGFVYAGQEYVERTDALIATFEDPERPGLPVTLVLGNEARVVVESAGTLQPGWKPWVRTLRAGEIASYGPIGADGSPWSAELVRLGFTRVANERGLVPIADPKPGVVGRAARDLDPERVARYSWSCVRARERAVGWCAPDTGIPSAEVVLWSSASDYAAHGDPDRLSRFDPVDQRVDALLLSMGEGADARTLDDGGAAVVLAGVWNRLGPPAEPWMIDAAGVDAAWSWWGVDLDAWLARTRASSADLPLSRLVDDEAGRTVSAHVLSPRRAALWRFLRDSRGDAYVRELWLGSRTLDVDANATRAFSDWLASRVERGASALSASRLERRRARERVGPVESGGAGLVRGLGACEPAPDPRDAAREGYGSPAFERTLARAVETGANAISIGAFTRDVAGPPALFDDARAHELVAREGDARVFAALVAAKARGLAVFFAPHLVAGDGGTWAGTWTRANRGEWEAFFERYARFVEHHALTAELAGADLFSIGSGQWAVTGGEPEGRRVDPEEAGWRSAGWARVVASARAAFEGRLVYSAGAPDELPRVSFFGDVDVVGLELAPDLDRDDASDGLYAGAEIGRQIEIALTVLDRTARASGKPALITQASFRPALRGAARALGPGTASSAWHAAQYREMQRRLEAWRGRLDLFGVFAWRTGDASVGGEHDVRVDGPDVRDAVSELLRSLR